MATDIQVTPHRWGIGCSTASLMAGPRGPSPGLNPAPAGAGLLQLPVGASFPARRRRLVRRPDGTSELPAGEVGAVELRAGEVGAPQQRAGKVGAPQVREGEVGAVEKRVGEVSAGEIRVGEVSAVEMRAGEIGVPELRAGQMQ